MALESFTRRMFSVGMEYLLSLEEQAPAVPVDVRVRAALLAGLSKTNVQIAREVGVDPRVVSRVRRQVNEELYNEAHAGPFSKLSDGVI